MRIDFDRLALCLIAFFLCNSIVLNVYSEGGEEGETVEKVYINVPRSNVRAGPGAEYKSLKVMVAGQGLDLVGADGNWFKVQLVGGEVGWISRKAVTSTPPAPVVVKSLKQQLTTTQAENDDLSKEIRRLSDARQDLELENSRLRSDVAILASANEELKSWRTILWVGLGLLVLFVGWGLGFLTGMFRKQADDKRYERLIRDAGSKTA